MLDQLKDLIGKVMPDVDTSSVNENTRIFEDLGFDSLAFMMLSIELENQFGITFDGPVNFAVVGDVVKYLEEHKK